MHKDYMKKAIELAKLGEGKVGDNPLVGAVIVKNGRIIGSGYHGQTGRDHAELEAFKNAREDVENASLYVNLEPCSHYGKTPPCADLIIEKKIKRVYIAMEDPNKKVQGRGIEKLKEAGIKVELGILEPEARQLNEIFIKNQLENKPFLLMKSAMSLDGKIATRTGDSQWISGELARKEVHRIRNKYRGIMIGVETALRDNPSLTCRIKGGRNPVRIILDTSLRIDSKLDILKNQNIAKTVIVTSEKKDRLKEEALEKMGVKILTVSLKNGRVDMPEALEKLYGLGINSILLEGGASLNYSALEEGLVDKFLIYMAGKIIGGSQAKTPVEGLGIESLSESFKFEITSFRKIGPDLRIEAYRRD